MTSCVNRGLPSLLRLHLRLDVRMSRGGEGLYEVEADTVRFQQMSCTVDVYRAKNRRYLLRAKGLALGKLHEKHSKDAGKPPGICWLGFNWSVRCCGHWISGALYNTMVLYEHTSQRNFSYMQLHQFYDVAVQLCIADGSVRSNDRSTCSQR